MKMAQYSPDIIRFMCDASEYGTYHRDLADRISASISEDGYVCDAGCGLGYLSLALSRYCREISAVDISPRALAVLEQNIRRTGCRNIRVTEGDIAACPPEKPYDVMVFCFFGNTDEALRIAKAQCSGKAVLIKKDWNFHRFSLSPRLVEQHTLEQTCSELNSQGIRFRCETFALEMGQPFHSLSDAAMFFRIYSNDDEPGLITEEDVLSRLVPQASDDYPYYLPVLKRMGMVVLDTGNIPDTRKDL
jgi:precorrin-6B methylase 2